MGHTVRLMAPQFVKPYVDRGCPPTGKTSHSQNPLPLAGAGRIGLGGPLPRGQRELFDFIVAELRQREPLDSARICPVRVALERQRESLLGFARVLDEKLAKIARQFRAIKSGLSTCCNASLKRHQPIGGGATN